MTMWGKEHDDKASAFDRDVEEIEQKYFDLFSDQTNRITGKKPDRLNNHFILQWNNDFYQVGFHKETYVPKNVQEEVFASFKKNFDSKT